MSRAIHLLSLLLLCSGLSAQISPFILTTLDPVVGETSGLVRLDGRLLTHNDSGDGPRIYEVDTANGNMLRTVLVENASASDWEDIAVDSTYIYIGDFGNNAGNRTNLRIFRVSQADYLAQDTVQADTINFSYADQTDFSNQTFSTNFDAEALVALGDSLYIFTKNWGNFRTNIYPLPKVPGTYSLVKQDSIDSQGLVTGAEYDPNSNSIWLVGYFLSIQFLVEVPSATGLPFSGGATTRFGFTPSPAIQVEGICPVDGQDWFVSAEAGQGSSMAHLYQFAKPIVATEAPFSHSLSASPNPGRHQVRLEAEGVEIAGVQWYSVEGKWVAETSGYIAETSTWARGLYIAEAFDRQGTSLGRTRVVLE